MRRLTTFAILPLVALFLLLGASQQRGLTLVGAVTGTVRDPEGRGIAEALITLDGSSYRTRTIEDGRFLLDSVLEGAYVIQVEREGYRTVRAEVRVPKDSAVDLAITLQPDGQQLGAVRVNERVRSRIVGRVADEDGKALSGVTVAAVGLGWTATTDSLGMFWFGDLPPGTYLLEARHEGYERSRYPVRMIDGLERNISMKLRRGARAMTVTDLYNAAMASREAGSRHGMRQRTNTMILGRDRLAAFGRLSLDLVLAQTEIAGAGEKIAAGAYCVLEDGVRPLSRGVQSMDDINSASGNSFSPAGKSASKPPPSDGWLRAYFADQIEMLEVYPAGTDPSRTLCGRFTPGSGCMCMPGQPTPPTVVVWLR